MSDAIAVKQEAQLPAHTATNEPASLLRFAIERGAPIDQLERLMQMDKQVRDEQSERAVNVSMRSAQADMRPISADANNPQTKSRYATYAKLDTALRPIYTKHGFALSFDEGDSPKPDHIRVLCYVTHDCGHTRTYRKDMPADGKGAKGGDVMTKTHASGAAASYGMRYLLKGIFNVAVGEDDKDGNAPKDTAATISPEQVGEIRELVESVDGSTDEFCKAFKIASVGDLPAARFDFAMKEIKARIKSRGGK